MKTSILLIFLTPMVLGMRNVTLEEQKSMPHNMSSENMLPFSTQVAFARQCFLNSCLSYNSNYINYHYLANKNLKKEFSSSLEDAQIRLLGATVNLNNYYKVILKNLYFNKLYITLDNTTSITEPEDENKNLTKLGMSKKSKKIKKLKDQSAETNNPEIYFETVERQIQRIRKRKGYYFAFAFKKSLQDYPIFKDDNQNQELSNCLKRYTNLATLNAALSDFIDNNIQTKELIVQHIEKILQPDIFNNYRIKKSFSEEGWEKARLLLTKYSYKGLIPNI